MTSIDITLDRWLSRVEDPAESVRERAAIVLADIAQKHPHLRVKALPAVLALMKNNPENCNIYANSPWLAISSIPVYDKQWLGIFLKLYIHQINEGINADNGLYSIKQLLDESAIPHEHPLVPELMTAVRRRLSTHPDPDERGDIFVICDWDDDNE